MGTAATILLVLAMVLGGAYVIYEVHIRPKGGNQRSTECQLVFQIPVTDMKEADAVLALQASMEQCLSKQSFVDGNDISAGTGNIFVVTIDPARALREGVRTCRAQGLTDNLVVAQRKLKGQKYTVVFPADHRVQFSITGTPTTQSTLPRNPAAALLWDSRQVTATVYPSQSDDHG